LHTGEKKPGGRGRGGSPSQGGHCHLLDHGDLGAKKKLSERTVEVPLLPHPGREIVLRKKRRGNGINQRIDKVQGTVLNYEKKKIGYCGLNDLQPGERGNKRKDEIIGEPLGTK